MDKIEKLVLFQKMYGSKGAKYMLATEELKLQEIIDEYTETAAEKMVEFMRKDKTFKGYSNKQLKDMAKKFVIDKLDKL